MPRQKPPLDPDCTGDPNLWPWAIRSVPSRASIRCSTVGCKRKPGKVLKTTNQDQSTFCQTCRKRQVQKWWDLKFGSKSEAEPPDPLASPGALTHPVR